MGRDSARKPDPTVALKPIKIIMVHENDKDRGGCEFGTFFGTTPQGLLDEGIYSDIAIALHTPPHRTVSLTLAAQALGATEAGAGAMSFRSLRRSSMPRWLFNSTSSAPNNGTKNASVVSVATVVTDDGPAAAPAPEVALAAPREQSVV